MKKELIILHEDKIWVRKRITELEKAIQELGPEFYDVFNQSSETWHDNAPFDALRDRQSVLDAELQQLKSVLRSGLLEVPKQKEGITGIGSRVTLEDEGGTRSQYLVAGDWTPYAGQIKNGALVISAQAPLAQQLLGKKVGDQMKIGSKIAKIVKIRHNLK